MRRAIALLVLWAGPVLAETPPSATEAWDLFQAALLDATATPETLLEHFSSTAGSDWTTVRVLLSDPLALGLPYAVEAESGRRLSCMRLGPESLGRLASGQDLGAFADLDGDGALSARDRPEDGRLFRPLLDAGTLEAVVSSCTLSLPIRDGAGAIAAIVDPLREGFAEVEVTEGIAAVLTGGKAGAQGHLVRVTLMVDDQRDPAVLTLEGLGVAAAGF